MEHTDFDGIIFADTLQDFNALRHTGRVIHILCSGGNMGFTFQDTRYHIAAGDYVILPGFVYYLNSHSQQLRHHRTFVTFAESGHETFIS